MKRGLGGNLRQWVDGNLPSAGVALHSAVKMLEGYLFDTESAQSTRSIPCRNRRGRIFLAVRLTQEEPVRFKYEARERALGLLLITVCVCLRGLAFNGDRTAQHNGLLPASNLSPKLAPFVV